MNMDRKGGPTPLRSTVYDKANVEEKELFKKRVLKQFQTLFKKIKPDVVVEIESGNLLFYFIDDINKPRAEIREGIGNFVEKSDEELTSHVGRIARTLTTAYEIKENKRIYHL